MIVTSFTVENFRCFKKLEVEPLERINLIGGMNNLGKTALLEAIYLHFGLNKMELPLFLNQNRGMETRSLDLEEICNWLFYERQVSETIQTIAVFDNSYSALILGLVASSEIGVYLSQSRLPSIGLRQKKLSLAYRNKEGMVTNWRIFLEYEKGESDKTKLNIETVKGKMGILPPLFFLDTDRVSSRENIEWYSELEEKRKDTEIIETLKLIEPRLQELSILVKGRTPTLYADLNMDYLMPLPLFGEGMERLLSIVLAIANAPGGIVLIDEIENGLHHSVLVKVWQAIADAARRSDTQVFATTHSLECIRAAHQAFSTSDRYDFRYHRLERVQNEIKAMTYDKEAIETSTEMNLEMR
ncbi:MAG: AAA family ATPase [Cyanobacteriota bacterium]|nr:AAA family ATPase [Cyanobacteriota bacterium]